jgi:hypothetical protein
VHSEDRNARREYRPMVRGEQRAADRGAHP